MPLIIISHNAINLEKPAEQRLKIKENTKSKSNVKHDVVMQPKSIDKSPDSKDHRLTELDVVRKLKKKIIKDDKSMKQVFKRKKAKGPNTLSCKKSKKKKIKIKIKNNLLKFLFNLYSTIPIWKSSEQSFSVSLICSCNSIVFGFGF